jgi:hypothetical protein
MVQSARLRVQPVAIMHCLKSMDKLLLGGRYIQSLTCVGDVQQRVVGIGIDGHDSLDDSGSHACSRADSTGRESWPTRQCARRATPRKTSMPSISIIAPEIARMVSRHVRPVSLAWEKGVEDGGHPRLLLCLQGRNRSGAGDSEARLAWMENGGPLRPVFGGS